MALSVSRVQACKPVARSGARAPLRVVCKATSSSSSSPMAKQLAVLSSLPATLAASPAFALVDDRMNGDGTGLPFGVNEPVLGWAILGVFTTIWILYFISQKDLGDFEDADDGLKL